MLNQYDVIVVGGGTAGCAAAYTAGKLGLNTLLIEKTIHLGGTITSGLVIPAMDSSKSQINTDFYTELINELADLKGQITYQDNPGWFNPELCKIALDRLMIKANVDILFNTIIDRIDFNNKRIIKLTYSSGMLSEYISAKYIIDATGNCEISALANCNFLQKENELQPVSLRFEMSGIDLKKFSHWLLDFDRDRDVSTAYNIDGQIHLSTACTWDSNKEWALKPLFDDAVDKGIIIDTDRSYFQLFTVPGAFDTVAFNCPRICSEPEIDPLSPQQTSKALINARESILRIAEFCRIYLPGFDKSYISNIADALGVRVSRRIKGKYIYTVEDLRSGKKFDNPVLISNYPIDVHSNKNSKSILEHTTQDYQLPVESLMSADIDNLFVVGRCISADFLAQAALRIQPSCFSMGEGVAKYIYKLLK